VSMCGDKEDGRHSLIGCSQTENCRTNLTRKMWSSIHEEVIYEKVRSNEESLGDTGEYF
jgi:hypothetical protein